MDSAQLFDTDSSNDATLDYSLGCSDYSLDSENTNGIEFGTHFLTGKIADKMQGFPEFEDGRQEFEFPATIWPEEPEVIYECSMCPKTFSIKPRLFQHFTMKHEPYSKKSPKKPSKKDPKKLQKKENVRKEKKILEPMDTNANFEDTTISKDKNIRLALNSFQSGGKCRTRCGSSDTFTNLEFRIYDFF